MRLEGDKIVLEYRSDIDKMQRMIDVYRNAPEVLLKEEVDSSFADELDKLYNALDSLWYCW